MSRRLFQRFQKRVERFAGEHVNFVDNIYLISASRWTNIGSLPQSADFVDAAVGRAVDFENVGVVACRNSLTGFAFAARSRRRSVYAIEGFGENSGRRRFTDPSGAGKKVSVSHAPGRYRVRQRGFDVLLTDNVLKTLGTVTASDNHIIGRRIFL